MAEVQGDIQINTANIDDDDVMTPEQADRAAEEQRQIQAENEEKVRKQEENAKKRKQIQDERKRQREENAKKKQEEQEKQEQEKKEEKRKQAEEEQKKKEDEAKKIRRYDEYLDVKKTIFLQMPTFSLFTLLSKQKYKLLYIPYTYIVETDELKQEYKKGGANTNKSKTYENKSDSSSSWFGSNRNDKLIEINVDKNQITNYNIGATYDKQMKEYKNFDVEMLYVRLIFSINKSKEISLYNIFLYYIINVRGKTSTRPDVYKLDNFTLYDDELEILNKKNSKLDIADLLTEETKETNKNVYYVYIYDIIKNKMVAEFNIANLDNIHNVSNENTTYGGIKESKPNNSRTKLQNKTHNHKNAKTIRTYRNANRGKTLRNLRK